MQRFKIGPNESINDETTTAAIKLLGEESQVEDSAQRISYSVWRNCLQRTGGVGFNRSDLCRLALILGVFGDTACGDGSFPTLKSLDASSSQDYRSIEDKGSRSGLRTLIMRKLVSSAISQAPDEPIVIDGSQNRPSASPSPSSSSGSADSESGDDLNGLNVLARECLQDVFEWAAKSSTSFKPDLKSMVHPVAFSSKLSAALVSNETAVTIFPSKGLTTSPDDILFYSGANTLNQLRDSSVMVIGDDSSSPTVMKVSEVVRSGMNGISVRGAVTQSQSLPAEVKNHKLSSDATRQAGETNANIQHAIFNTTLNRISSQVRLIKPSSAAGAGRSFASTDFVGLRKGLSTIGMSTEVQGGGGMNACAPMSIVRHLLTSGGVPLAEVDTASLVQGASKLRLAAREFLTHPRAVCALFHHYLSSVGVGAGATKSEADAIEGVLFEVLNELSNSGDLSFIDLESAQTARFPTSKAPTASAELRKLVLEAIINMTGDQGVREGSEVTPYMAATALNRLKSELDLVDSTGDRTLHVYSLLMSAAGAFRIGWIASDTTCFHLNLCLDVGQSQLALLFQMPNHWEAVVSVDADRMALPDDVHCDLMANINNLWRSIRPAAGPSKSTVTKSASSTQPPKRTQSVTPQPDAAASSRPHASDTDHQFGLQSIINLIQNKYKNNIPFAKRQQMWAKAAAKIKAIPLSFIHQAANHGHCVFGTLCNRKGSSCNRAHHAISSTSPPSVKATVPPPASRPTATTPDASSQLALNAMSETTKNLVETSKQIKVMTKSFASIVKDSSTLRQPESLIVVQQQQPAKQGAGQHHQQQRQPRQSEPKQTISRQQSDLENKLSLILGLLHDVLDHAAN